MDEKKYWISQVRYDWYNARIKGSFLEKIYLNLQIRDLLSLIKSKNKRILDLACGTGVYTHSLYQKSKNTIGVDISPWAIKKAKENFKHIPFYVMDAEKTKFEDNYFDIIVSTGLIQYINDPKLAVKEIYRILKPGGMIIVEAPWKYGPYNSRLIRKYITNKNNPNNEPLNRCYNAKEMKKVFKKFKCVKMYPFLLFALHGVFKKPVLKHE